MPINDLADLLASFGLSSAFAAGVAIIISSLIAGLAWTLQGKRLNNIEIHRSELAKEVEQLRSQLSATERRLQSQLDVRTHVHRAQFEHEFKLYQTIWPLLSSLKDASDGRYNESEAERIMALTGDTRPSLYDVVSQKLVTALDGNKPFYPSEVYTALDAARQAVERSGPEHPDLYDVLDPSGLEESRLREEVTRRIDEACEAIRTRLASIVPVDG